MSMIFILIKIKIKINIDINIDESLIIIWEHNKKKEIANSA
jgi:hypothetical protein